MSQKVHPFEISDLGLSPFKFVGIWETPIQPEEGSTLGQWETYQYALINKPECCKGYCMHCSEFIKIHCIIESSDGKRSAVGSTCIQKNAGEGCADKALIAVKQRERELRQKKSEEKRQREHEEWMETVCNDKGETNSERISREFAEMKQAKEKAKNDSNEKWGFMLDALNNAGSFGRSLAESINEGSEPSGRGVDIALEIYAKQFGRTNSKKYNEAYDYAYNKINNRNRNL
tara:strand:+ start:57 stop:752 length:696 start_codon:yes stop_codon:yes gene_type:complete